MFGLRVVDHELIKQTPISLLALTRHPIEPHEENWFSRCRADYLRSFPLSLLELVRLTLLLSLVGPFTNVTYSVLVIIGWGAVMVSQVSVRKKELQSGFDQTLALRYRYNVIRLRAYWWFCALAMGMFLAPYPSLAALAALGIIMMVIDGLSTLSLPFLALATSIGGGVATAAGLLARGGWDAAPFAIMILVLVAFLHWSIFNLYYLFATRRIRTRRLAESKETIQLVLNQYDDEGSDWLYEIDSEGRIQNPSSRFAAACGIEIEKLEDIPLTMLFHEGNNRHDLQNKLDHLEPFRNLVVPLTAGSEERWWSISGRPIEQLRGEKAGWRGFISDMSEAKEAESKIAYMAHYDLLTNLPNRTLFSATLDRVMSRLSPLGITGLLFVDLDRFKEINDGYGHEAGDAVLADVGRRLEQAIRPGDMVARLGGDEFAVLLPDLPSREAGLDIADRILGAMQEPITINGQLMPVGASIGAAFAPEDGATGDELLRSADLAMYNAKIHGRNGISIFNSSMREEMQDRRDLAVGLRNAVLQGEMEVHYQPLIEISTGATMGYEALLRWDHPTRGMVPPAEFIPIAEETGLIIEIGEWVLRTALADAAHWPEHQTVAVNISPAQMRDERLLHLIANALAVSGVAPNRLELEITENLIIQNTEEVLELLHKLRKMGVRISLDDFGTGYSSLTYLHSFPFDKIKIDQRFIEGLVEREDCQAIVQSVITLANDLHMITTAEGVETEEQLNALRERGCGQVQGYFFSKAVPSQHLANNFHKDDGKVGKANVRKLARREQKSARSSHSTVSKDEGKPVDGSSELATPDLIARFGELR